MLAQEVGEADAVGCCHGGWILGGEFLDFAEHGEDAGSLFAEVGDGAEGNDNLGFGGLWFMGGRAFRCG